MTLTPPDRVSPAQPPGDGRRALLVFSALTAAVYVAGALAVVAVEVLVR